MIRASKKDLESSKLVRIHLSGKETVYPLIEFSKEDMHSEAAIAAAAIEAFRWIDNNNLLAHESRYEIRIKSKVLVTIVAYCRVHVTDTFLDACLEESEIVPLKGYDDWVLVLTPHNTL